MSRSLKLLLYSADHFEWNATLSTTGQPEQFLYLRNYLQFYTNHQEFHREKDIGSGNEFIGLVFFIQVMFEIPSFLLEVGLGKRKEPEEVILFSMSIFILRMVLYGFISDLNLVQILYTLNENHITGGYISRIALIGIDMHGNLIFRIYPYQNISKYQFTIS